MTGKPTVDLLADVDVRRWYENMQRTSKLNAAVRLRRLNLFCHRTGTTPAGLAAAGTKDPKEAEDMLHDHVSWMEGRGYSPMYIEGTVKAVKAWLEYNRVDVRRKIRVTNPGMPTRIADERIPDQGQLRKILATAGPRERAVVCLMAFSGLRPQVLGLSDASDGLRISDLADLRVAGGEASFVRTPAMVTVRASLSKTRNKYVTFLSEEGCEHLLGYLRQRLAQGDPLGPDSPVIATSRRNRRKGWRRHSPTEQPFMTTTSISVSVRPAIWAVTKVRPYALRAYFDSQLLIAESHGCMTHSYRQFFMGHKGDMEARYTTNKGRLTEQMSEDMRRSYANSEVFLSARPAGDATQARRDMLLGMWRKQAEMHGLDPGSVAVGAAAGGGHAGAGGPRGAGEEGGDRGEPDPGAGAAPAAARDVPPSAAGADPPAAAPAAGAMFEAAIVEGEDDLVARCAAGWDVIREVGSGRFLMRRAAGLAPAPAAAAARADTADPCTCRLARAGAGPGVRARNDVQ